MSLRARVLGPLGQQQSVFVHEPMIVALKPQSPTLSVACCHESRRGCFAWRRSSSRGSASSPALRCVALAWRRLSSSHADPQIPTEYEQPGARSSSSAAGCEAAQQPGGPRADECALRGDELTAGGPAQRRARGHSARMLEGTGFGCRSRFVYGVFAEMHVCSRAISFLGSRKSRFSAHILAMREARGAARNRTAHWL